MLAPSNITMPSLLLTSLLIQPLALLLLWSSPCGAIAVNKGSAPRILAKDVTSLHIERTLVPTDVAENLYHEILESALPGPRDNFHVNLLGIKGDAGVDAMLTPGERATRFRAMVGRSQTTAGSVEKESGILRVEHLQRSDYNHVEKQINDVIQNRVLQDDGTIHVYVSKPNSAALANHTDDTDIFVLQLQGAKEWLLCQDQKEIAFLDTSPLRGKLDKCSTYDDTEINNLSCKRETLLPGDGLYLPKGVVHSARASQNGLSAHITFGFANANTRTCPTFDQSKETMSTRQSRMLQSTCNAGEGGTSCDANCNSGCNESCNSGCNQSCDCGCAAGNAYCGSCCDSACDSGCNTYCNSFCNSSCDTCPNSRFSVSSDNVGLIAGLAGAGLLIVVAVVTLAVCRYPNVPYL